MEPRLKLIELESQPEAGTATSRILKELGSEDGRTLEIHVHDAAAAEGGEEGEEEDSHVDERWLVSYADMMTLLFGLFVMLYSMVGSFDIVKSSAAKRFGGAPKPPEPAQSSERPNQDLDALRSRIQSLEAETARLREELSSSEKKSAGLTALLADARTHAAVAVPSSLTVVMKWSTAQHDLDLVVRDPEGRVYDFKHRDYAGHPGKMVLDSRHGPGAELWQADRILPGTYEVTALFYNPYGNPEPARVALSILTSQGALDLKESSLSFEKNPRLVFRFTAKADGTVRLAN